MWFKESYWGNYNVVEAAAWIAKAAVIHLTVLYSDRIV